MTKSDRLAQIEREIENCNVCKVKKSGRPVPGEGNPDAKIIFIGEAPGRTEAATGRPFVGRSGKFLRKAISELGLAEDEVFITSPVKYLPDYITPTDKDIEHGMTHLASQLDVIEPEVLVLLGRVAVKGVLGQELMIGKNHGDVITRGGKSYFVSYHPAAAIRFTKVRNAFIADLKKLKKLVG